MTGEKISDEDIKLRFLEEWDRAKCKDNGGVSYRKSISFELNRRGIETLAIAASRVPEFDVHYILTGERTTYRLPEEDHQILSKIAKLDVDERFLLERQLD